MLIVEKGIITSTARLHKFPVPLSSTAEQTYLTGLLYGWGPRDDSAMVRMYYPDPIAKVQSSKSPEEAAADLEKVVKLMTYTNICAAAEAIAFARFLKVDTNQFYDLVVNAAGGSKIFRTLGDIMIKGIPKGPAPEGTLSIDRVIEELSEIIQKGRDLYTPLNLATEALNVFLLAQRQGWGAEASTSVIRVWEN